MSQSHNYTSTNSFNFRFDFQPHGLPIYPQEPPSSSRFPVSPTPIPKPAASYRPFGKENKQPDLHQQNLRVPSPAHVYTPHMARDTSSLNPLYNHAYARSYSGFSTTQAFNISSAFQSVNPMIGDFRPIGQVHRSQSHPGPSKNRI